MPDKIFTNNHDIIACAFALLLWRFQEEDNWFAAQCNWWLVSSIQYTELLRYHLEYNTFLSEYMRDCIVTPSLPQDSLSIRSKFPVWFRVRFRPRTGPLQRVSTQNPLLKSQHFLLQLSIGVLIASWHNLYVKYAVWRPLYSPILRFAIGWIAVESRWKPASAKSGKGILSVLGILKVFESQVRIWSILLGPVIWIILSDIASTIWRDFQTWYSVPK